MILYLLIRDFTTVTLWVLRSSLRPEFMMSLLYWYPSCAYIPVFPLALFTYVSIMFIFVIQLHSFARYTTVDRICSFPLPNRICRSVTYGAVLLAYLQWTLGTTSLCIQHSFSMQGHSNATEPRITAEREFGAWSMVRK